MALVKRDGLTAAEVEAFERDGFLLVEDVLEDSERTRYGQAVDQAVRGRAGSDGRSLEDKTVYEQSFVQCINLWEDCLDVRALCFDPVLGGMAAALLGVDGVRIWHDQALYKEAGGRVTDPHQDRPFWPITPASQVTAWIPFDGSARDAGAMYYVPGSHRLDLEKFVDISQTFQPEPYDILRDPKVRDIEPVRVEAPPGSVVFHHCLTVHGADANLTSDLRRVYCIIYFADGCTRSSPFPHQTVDRQKTAVGEQIAGEVTPLAFPREPGELPPTPPGRPPRVGFAGG